ncbi:MAG: thioredoxin-disulfide reductase [Candidatus Eisenbacteria bacterium]
MATVHDILILGSGAAGYTAAIYAGRADRKPVVICGIQHGGQLTITTDVENYPGFAEPIMGPELMERMKQQAIRSGATLVEDLTQVDRVDFTRRPFRVWTDDGREWQARVVVIATGASAKWIGLPSEQHFMGRGVSACATCDGPFYKGRHVVVVGGGDTAMEEATYLAQLCNEVVVVHRRDTLRASKAMQDRAMRNPRIHFVWDSEVIEVLGAEAPSKVTGVRIRNLKTGATSDLATDALFVAIGHQPNTGFLAGALATDERGYLKVETGTTRTSIPGVFAAGDVADPVYRQAVTAAGMGCMAAIEAEHLLQHEAHLAETGAAAGH